MAGYAVDERGVSVAVPCSAFSISQRCLRYVPLLADENEEIEDWLIALAKVRKNRGFGLCYRYLRNIKGLKWNHKRVRRIYCDLELNLRIKPRKLLKRERPDPLSVPDQPNQVWSMDFMSDQLWNGKPF
jgi:putative transposase